MDALIISNGPGIGGILEERGRFLQVLIHTVVTRIKRISALIVTTVIACGNITMGEAYTNSDF